MKDLITKIHEDFLKPRETNYSLKSEEAKVIKAETELKNTFNLQQIKMYEELEYLVKNLKHSYIDELIEFVLNYVKK